MDRTSVNSKEIKADIETVWKAFTEKSALEYWLSPYGMTGKIHNFDLKVGGGYEMSLYYNDTKTEGKTSGNEDRYSATFTEIKPFEKVVQTINFQSDTNEFKDEMTMEVQLDKLDTNSTKVTILFKNIPYGIDPKDNEDGTEQSLQKLATFIEGNNTSNYKNTAGNSTFAIGWILFIAHIKDDDNVDNAIFEINYPAHHTI